MHLTIYRSHVTTTRGLYLVVSTLLLQTFSSPTSIYGQQAGSENIRPLIEPELAHFYVADGRLCCVVKTRQNHRRERTGERFHHQRVTVDAGATPTVRFVAVSDDMRAELNFKRGRVDVVLVGASRQSLRQTPNGQWLVSQPHGDDISFPSFWHMLLAGEPYVAPLTEVLQLLRPRWQLLEQTDRLRDSLIQCDRAVVSRPLVERWVQELGSDDFAARRRADKALRSFGQQVIPALRQMDPLRLNTEQQRRVQRIVRGCRTDQEDDVSRLVNQLAGDVWVWCKLLNDPDQDVRELAQQRVTEIVGVDVPFDVKAVHDTRVAQITRIERDLQVR